MKKEIERDSEEWKIFNRIWKFYQDYAIPENKDDYWESIVKEISKIEKEYNHPLANWLAYGVAKALNDIMKGEK